MLAHIEIPYGRSSLTLNTGDFDADFTVLQPPSDSHREIGREEVLTALENPIGAPSPNNVIDSDMKLCIVTSDGTRPFLPMRLMLHALLEHLGDIPADTTVITGSGTHQPHTDNELDDLFGRDLRDRLKIIPHDCRSKEDNVQVGEFSDGMPLRMNKYYVGADYRIVLGHIEPHFFTGFTGGPKGIAPAVCDMDTINYIHSFKVIADAGSTFGRLDNNPSRDLICEAAAAAPPTFLMNAVLNRKQKPIAIYCGDYLKAHEQGMKLSREISGIAVNKRFPIVIISNSGWPLDQNLYQTVKGINLAAEIVEPGGVIIIVSECSQGIPDGGNFGILLNSDKNNETLLHELSNEKDNICDRWQVQRLLQILKKAIVILVSDLDSATIEKCRLQTADSIESAIKKALPLTGNKEIAVVPDGPQVFFVH